jgi:hypothetical protein
MLKSFESTFDPSKLYEMHFVGGREGGTEGNDTLTKMKAVIHPLLN